MRNIAYATMAVSLVVMMFVSLCSASYLLTHGRLGAGVCIGGVLLGLFLAGRGALHL